MESKDQKIQILAQAVYELRLLLSSHLGSPFDEASAEKIAAHLSYALHNDALAIIENREDDFVVEATLKRLNHVDGLFGNKPNSSFKNVVNAKKT